MQDKTIHIPELRDYYEQMRLFNEEQRDDARRLSAWLPVVSGGPDTDNPKTKKKTR